MSVWPNALESLTATLNKFQGQTYYCFGPGAYLGILQVKIGLLRGGGWPNTSQWYVTRCNCSHVCTYSQSVLARIYMWLDWDNAGIQEVVFTKFYLVK